MGGPLAGIRVLDLGNAGVGPWAASVLGMLGADVIRVESPGGDRLHSQPPFQNGVSTTYTICNMNKRNAVLNLKEPEGRQALERMVREADVVMENLKAGTLDKLGFGYQRLKELNPRIIYASCPGWGFEGPMQDLPAIDPLIQAFSGYSGLNGTDPMRPKPMQYPYLDFNASCFFATAVLLAVLARNRTGETQRVTCTQLGSAIALQISKVAELFTTGTNPVPMGSACVSTVPNQAFECQDKKYLAVSVERDAQWLALCRALGLDDLAKDARFVTNSGRVKHRQEIVAKLEETFRTKPARRWAIKLAKEAVPHGYFYDYETMRNHQQVVENEFFVSIDVPHSGRMDMGGIPWRFSKTPAVLKPAPKQGQHTEEIKKAGFGASTAGRPAITAQRDGGSPFPLAGVKVVDVSQGLAGPFTSMMLAEAGADVTKIEPPEGDYVRNFVPQVKEGESAVFQQLNRGKRLTKLDLGQEEGRKALANLLKDADVFIEDLGVGGAEAIGLGYDALAKKNPGLVVCHITPFGDKGPMSKMPGSELVAQAVGEYWTTVTWPGEAPMRLGADIATLNTGCMAAIGILSALCNRASGGSGQRVDVSFLGTLMCMRGAMWAAVTDPDDWYGLYCDSYTIGSIRGYQSKDGPIYLNLHNSTEEDYVNLLLELGMEEALSDPRFQNGGRNAIGTGRYAHEVAHIWNEKLSSRTADEVIEIFIRNKAMGCRFNSLEQVLQSEQVKTLKVITEVGASNQGKTKFVRPPWKGPWGEVPIDGKSVYKTAEKVAPKGR